MSFLLYFCVALLLIISIFLILLVLIQKGRGGGLASAFGGGGGNTAFGSKTGDVLSWATSIVLFIFVSLFMILLILIQKGRGGGLASSFGGGGGGNTAFGSKTGDVLTWATSIVFGIFLILSMGTVKVADTINSQRKATLGQTNQTSAPVAPAPAPSSPAPMSTPLPEAPSTQP
jgi:preprotein translocase subunit SecG